MGAGHPGWKHRHFTILILLACSRDLCPIPKPYLPGREKETRGRRRASAELQTAHMGPLLSWSLGTGGKKNLGLSTRCLGLTSGRNVLVKSRACT